MIFKCSLVHKREAQKAHGSSKKKWYITNSEKQVIAPTKRGQNLGGRLEVKWELNSRDMDEGTSRLEDIWTSSYCVLFVKRRDDR